MKKITDAEPESKSADLVSQNAYALRSLFPAAFAEGKLDSGVLSQLLGEAVDEKPEKYGLNWHGKRSARELALRPSTGTLRPDEAGSERWDESANVFIEGDNLEVLKLLVKPYAGRIKAIYLDPPYNTGNDFVYADDFSDPLSNYLAATGQVDDAGVKVTSNPESSGRFHTNWLNMMYPRLLVSRNLLQDDGVILISLDEGEIHNLRHLCDEVFGPECYVSTLTLLCNPKGRSHDKFFATNHEYVMVYSKSPLHNGALAVAKDDQQIAKDYPEKDEGGRFRILELRNTHREFGKHNRPNLTYPLFVDSDGSVHLEDGQGRELVEPIWDDGFEGCWTWGVDKVRKERHLLVGREVNGRTKVYRKGYAKGAVRMLKTILTENDYFTERGQRELGALFGEGTRVFQSPKSPHLIRDLLETCTSPGDTVLDYFAGSGTTAQAIQGLNQKDNGDRRWILVQLPEALSPDVEAQAQAASLCDELGLPRTVAEVAKERIRRVHASSGELPSSCLGFRSFKLDSSNVAAWDPDRDDLSGSLMDVLEHVKEGRSDQDILFELVLKLGLELTVPIETRELAGAPVYSVGAGTLMACLVDKIGEGDVEGIAQGIADWHRELDPVGESTVVFRDDAFGSDVAKTNMTAILEQRGLATVRSL